MEKEEKEVVVAVMVATVAWSGETEKKEAEVDGLVMKAAKEKER